MLLLFFSGTELFHLILIYISAPKNSIFAIMTNDHDRILLQSAYVPLATYNEILSTHLGKIPMVLFNEQEILLLNDEELSSLIFGIHLSNTALALCCDSVRQSAN